MRPSYAPIGIYDSGVGGLTVWYALKKLVKQDLVYYGDTAHIPYGEKTKAQIIAYSQTIIDFLRKQQVRLIVAACNTSSALALPSLRLSTGLPLFGVIDPAVRKGIEATHNKKVGLIATVGTIDSGSYQKYFNSMAPDVALFPQKSPKLVPLVESGKLEGAEVNEALHEYLHPLLEKDIDTLILGCTHYPFLLRSIREIIGPKITIIDPAWQTARDVREWLITHNYADRMLSAKDQFWTSGDPQEFQKKAERFIGRQIDIVRYHQAAEEPIEKVDSFAGELSSIWRGDDDL